MAPQDPNEPLEPLPIEPDESARRPDESAGPPTTPRRQQLWRLAGAATAMIAALILVARLFGWVFEATPASAPSTPQSVSGAIATDTADVEFVIQPVADLFDRQNIQIRVTGFAESQTIAARMCLVSGLASGLSLPDRCDTGTYTLLEQRDDGAINTTYAVSRAITVGGRPVDCATESCQVEVLALQDGSSPIATSLDFDKDNTAFVPPRISIDPSRDIRGDQIVTLTGTALGPSTRVNAGLCVVGIPEDALNCWQPTVTQGGVTDSSGFLEMPFTVPRFVFVHSQWMDCANLEVGTCAVVLDYGSTERPANTAAVEFRPVALGLEDLDNLELTATPSTGLTEGSFITIKSLTKYFQDGDPTVEICPVGDLLACTELPIQSVFSDGNGVWFSVIARRQLAASNGQLHDCAADGACVLQIQLTTGDGEIAELPVDFSSDADPVHEIGIDPPRPQVPGSELTVSIVSVQREFELSVCVIDLADGCDLRPINAPTSAALGTTRFELQLGGELITSSGKVDCVRDAQCQIVLIDPTTAVEISSAPVNFDPSAPALHLVGAVRPRTNLADGETARLRLDNAFNHPYDAAVCAVGTAVCTVVATFDQPGRRAVAYAALPRFIFGPTGTTRPAEVIDCAATECELRFRSGLSHLASAVSFSSEDPRSGPELAIDATGPLVPGETINVRVRNLDPLPNEQQQPVLVLCDTATEDPYGDTCLLLERAIRSTTETTAEARFVVPSLNEREQADDTRVCIESCTIMFATAPGRRPAILAIDLAG